VISRALRIVVAVAGVTLVVTERDAPARDTPPEPRPSDFEDQALVERDVVLVRLDPKRGAPRGACDALSPQDLTVTMGGVAGRVTSVEHVPRPERHWLLLDISGSAESNREASKRSAQKYVREVMAPREDAATLVTIDDDVVLAAGPSTDPASLAARIDEIPPGGWSALRDGLDTVLRQIGGDRHEHLILYWTDGEDNISLTTIDELLATIDRTPHAAIFPIVLPPPPGTTSSSLPAGKFLFDAARLSGGEVLGAWDSKWLDRVRGWIARRFVISVAYPKEGASGRTAVSLHNKNCVATLLRDPFARPDPVAGAAAPTPAAWVRLHAKQKKKDDPACSGENASPSWDWPLRSEGNVLAGCLLDRIRPPALFAARDARVLAPAVTALPASLGDAIDAVASPDDGPSALLVSGSALLAQRARIAASLFAERRDYRDFALARLAELADDEILAIERSLARDFPDLPPDAIAAAARASRSGRRVLDASRKPTDADLASVLAAWLSDVPARSLFLQWECRLIDVQLASGHDPFAVARWAALRARVVEDDDVRVVAPLILIKDPGRRLIGFSRIALPRPPEPNAPPVDLVPERPIALLAVDRITARNGIRERLSAGGYRAVRIEEESTVPAWRAGLGDPFRLAHVTVELASSVKAARIVLEADVVTAGGKTTVARFIPSVTGDPELAALFQK
jgi:hypothetical protein